MDDEPQPVTMTATCHTPGCPMAEKPVTAPFYPNSDPPIYRGQCTQCDEPLADIVSATALTP